MPKKSGYRKPINTKTTPPMKKQDKSNPVKIKITKKPTGKRN